MSVTELNGWTGARLDDLAEEVKALKPLLQRSATHEQQLRDLQQGMSRIERTTRETQNTVTAMHDDDMEMLRNELAEARERPRKVVYFGLIPIVAALLAGGAAEIISLISRGH